MAKRVEGLTIQGRHYFGNTGAYASYLAEGQFNVDEDGRLIPGSIYVSYTIDLAEARERIPDTLELIGDAVIRTIVRYSIWPHIERYLKDNMII